ncbi:hypothetical protein D8674_017324 [Pyrus ussuriensis x Pyrus communis]|uniref:Secreted protein n=1 Tax=Pyrus ussuriensis x Pyrus communis TaxID=2448454 RepID=A0A5N5HQP3_9ROSA|nr:hypothetical protein D8674_017324 [Pyrus ussuriensis x Pyrus communis]
MPVDLLWLLPMFLLTQGLCEVPRPILLREAKSVHLVVEITFLRSALRYMDTSTGGMSSMPLRWIIAFKLLVMIKKFRDHTKPWVSTTLLPYSTVQFLSNLIISHSQFKVERDTMFMWDRNF